MAVGRRSSEGTTEICGRVETYRVWLLWLNESWAYRYGILFNVKLYTIILKVCPDHVGMIPHFSFFNGGWRKW